MRTKTHQFAICILILLMSNFIKAQDTNLAWAKRTGGAGADIGNSIVKDVSGNTYTIGSFEGIVDFDPSAGVFNLTALGMKDISISKMDASGNLIWAKSIGGTNEEIANAITIDLMGNIYLTGYYKGTVDFDPNAGTFSMIAAGNTDIFISKLDSSGNLLWAKGIGGTNIDMGYAIALDNLGNIYTTGIYQGQVDFDPGAGVFDMYGGLFILKLDALGDFIWSKSVGGTTLDVGRAIAIDASGNVIIGGYFDDFVDFDPNGGIFNVLASGLEDVFVLKLDAAGNFIWVKTMGGANNEEINSMIIDSWGNIFTTGYFFGTVDFDPNAGIYNLTSSGGFDIFISKLDAAGSFVWAKKIGGPSYELCNSLILDGLGNIYGIGYFMGTVDFDPSPGTFNLTSVGIEDIFISKLDNYGNFIWARSMGGSNSDNGNSIIVDASSNIYATGYFAGTTDFNPGLGSYNLTSSGAADIFTLRLRQKGVLGRLYHDFNYNCNQDPFDVGLKNRIVVINPGSIVAMTGDEGTWFVDSLPVGNYTVTTNATLNNNWTATCTPIQNFSVTNSNAITVAPFLGLAAVYPCTAPEVSISAPFLRIGFSNQLVYTQVCNTPLASDIIVNSYVIVELDSLFIVNSGSMPYTSLGNNRYQINLDTLYPGQCIDFLLSCTLSANAVLNSTLCMNATLYPVDSCALDSIPNPYLGTVSPCTLPWDHSSLSVEVSCVNDSVRFVIYNTGVLGGGDMDCFAPIRVYLDGQYIFLDSIQLQGGDSIVYMFAGNGQTWRLEADQHPLHPGNSHPNATIENCGTGTWTPNLVNVLPMNDADPVIDIYCGLVTAAVDPNDKTGFPLGVGSSHDIKPNQDLEYLIRFQNTGTDTAFNIVIRDTLSMDFDVFSVQSGVASHDYTFRMYGPRVLEWTFNNIMLPDSNVNEPGSHGFITFKVKQNPNLPDGTVLENSASIYFDFNAPIFTNTSWHTVNRNFIYLNTGKQAVVNKKEIKIYPNPTTGIINIDQGDSQEMMISVLDNLGRIVLQKQSNDIINSLNINHLSAGIYYVSINNGKEVVTQKVVKQ